MHFAMLSFWRAFALRAALFLSVAATVAANATAQNQPDAGMLRYPDVSDSRIVFVYAGDLWTVDRDGGVASPLAGPPGGEASPRFSPDGTQIAFGANYDGGRDLYVVPTAGGPAQRMTYHPARESLCDWTPAGELLFSTNGFAGLSRMQQLMTIAADRPLPQKLPVPYGDNGAISPDGRWLAYTPYSRDTRTWKRYRGGMASDIWLFHLTDHRSQRMTDWEGTDTLPMWHEQTVVYLSDAGPEHRLNLWSYDTNTTARQQITRFDDYDVKWPSIGPGENGGGEIVFQQGGDLRLLDLATGESRVVEVTMPGDKPKLRPQVLDAAEFIRGVSVSPSGQRIAVEARGDIWTAPAKNGTPRNLTRTDGVAERDPAWSPDGRWIAYFSDASGEYELTLTQSDGRGETRRLTSDGSRWRTDPVWSPDSKWIVFTDNAGTLTLHEIDGGKNRTVDTDPYAEQPDVTWSHDSGHLAYAKSADSRSRNGAIWVYSVADDSARQLTSGYFNDSDPAFDAKGDFLYYQSNRHFGDPVYEDVGTTFAYVETGVLLALPLRKDVENPLAPEIDEVKWDDEEESDAGDEDQSNDNKQDSDPNAADPDDAGDDADPVSGVWSMTVDLAVIPAEQRSVVVDLQLVDGGKVTGSLRVGGNEINIRDGFYDFATKTLTFAVTSPVGDASLKVVIQGRKFTGSVTIDALKVTAPIEAVRAGGGSSDDDDEKKKDKDDEAEKKPLVIEFDDSERRVIALPIGHGNFGGLVVNSKGQLIYSRQTRGGPSAIKLFDIQDDKPTEKEVLAGAGNFQLSPDRKKLLVLVGGTPHIVDAAAGQSLKDKVSTDGMRMVVDPRDEWKQIFTDAWRIQRDFFYDPNMHGVDWDAVRRRYEKLLADATSRDDVGFIIGEMISELNVGHAYYRGVSDGPDGPASSVGLPGCRLEIVDGRYRIAEIYEGAAWDTDARNPLSVAGIREGQFILDVEGRELTADVNPYAMLEGLAGRRVTLTISDDAVADPIVDEDDKDKNEKKKQSDAPENDAADDAADDEANDEADEADEAIGDRRVVIELLKSDDNLRFWDWIEANRRHVDESSDGRIGYLYVTNTGVDGQNDLFRQFYAQHGKDGLIIDDRWNGGGQIPTRFIELLNRPATNLWARRHGRDWLWPPDSHQGVQAMLINGLAGSGGDMFPSLFRQAGLGKLIGRRTWGGLVGITGYPSLIDGASVTAPSFAYYDLDGTWGIEGHGVDPDIEVMDDPALMVDGGDPQLDAAIEHVQSELQTKTFQAPPRPAYPDRAKMGLPESDK